MPLLKCGFDSRGVCALIRRGGSIEGRDGVVVGLAMLDGAVGVVGNLVRFGELFKGSVAGGAVDAVAGQVRFGVAVPDQLDGTRRGVGAQAGGNGGRKDIDGSN